MQKIIHIKKTFIFIILGLSVAWVSNMENALAKNDQGKNEYYLGRFSISIPDSMKQVNKHYILAYAEIEEIRWHDFKNKNIEAENYWAKLVSEIKSKEPPRGVENRLIEVDDYKSDVFKKGVLYYSNRTRKRKIKYSVFVDKGETALLVSIEGGKDYIGAIKKGIDEIERTYKIGQIQKDQGPQFVLENGFFNYGFNGKEETYFKFIGHPLKLQIEIETGTVKKVEKTNIIENLSSALAADFAPGVSIEKIRTRQKIVAGLKGDEVVMRGKEGKHTELSFAWHFNGEKNSEIAPEITIEMESPDGQLEEKLAVWDMLLDSMQVIPQ